MSIYAQLEQDQVWRTQDGRTVELSAMTPRHRANLLRWLERRAESLKFHYELMLISGGPTPETAGDMSCDVFDDGMRQLAEMDDAAWLNEFPLVERLRKLIAEDADWGLT